MEIHNLLDAKSRAELREWLLQNHKTEKECWVVVKRGRPTDDNTFWYIETSYFVGSSFQFLLSVLFIEPNIDDADNDYSISTYPAAILVRRCKKMQPTDLVVAGRAQYSRPEWEFFSFWVILQLFSVSGGTFPTRRFTIFSR